MDYSLIGAAATAITAAKSIGSAALQVRDFNQFAGEISKINEQLLKAQESLFAHNAQLLALQQEHFELAQQLRALREAADARGRRALFEVAPGRIAYRVEAVPGRTGQEGTTQPEPAHYLCQPCLDGPDRRTVVLLRGERHFGGLYLDCPVCKVELSLDPNNPPPDIAPGELEDRGMLERMKNRDRRR